MKGFIEITPVPSVRSDLSVLTVNVNDIIEFYPDDNAGGTHVTMKATGHVHASEGYDSVKKMIDEATE